MPYPHVITPTAITVAEPAPGSSLLDLCCRVADTVGFRVGTVVTDTPAAGETGRVVLSDELRDDEVGYDLMASGWLYVASGTQAQTQRRMVGEPEAGYQGPAAAVVVSRPFDLAPVGGDVIHVTSPLPMRRHLGVPGYREAINAGLALIWIEVRWAITGNGTDSYGLDEIAGYVQRGELQLVGLADTRSGADDDAPRRSSDPIRVVTSGAQHTLVVPTLYSTSQTFYLDTLLRADRLIWDGAGWQLRAPGVAPGLQNDTDECACPDDWAYTFGVWKAYEAQHRLLELRNGIAPEDRARADAYLTRQRASWAAAARGIKAFEMARPLIPPARPPAWVVSSAAW